MAQSQNSPKTDPGTSRWLIPANSDEAPEPMTSDQKLIAWLFRLTPSSLAAQPEASTIVAAPRDDWESVTRLCGHQPQDFLEAGASLPLTTAEIAHFRRNHRDVDAVIGRDFLAAQSDLPSPLAELYGLYRHRARLDAEAALFVAQATGSTRVASIMSDLLAVGAFAKGLEYITHMALTYAVPAAFDTADLIDRANQEASRRLALPIDHPAHLLKLTPDDIGVLAANIVEKNVLAPTAFIEKANLLAEARQDVNRLPPSQQFLTALGERDLPPQKTWVTRLRTAYARLFDQDMQDVAEPQSGTVHEIPAPPNP